MLCCVDRPLEAQRPSSVGQLPALPELSPLPAVPGQCRSPRVGSHPCSGSCLGVLLTDPPLQLGLPWMSVLSAPLKNTCVHLLFYFEKVCLFVLKVKIKERSSICTGPGRSQGLHLGLGCGLAGAQVLKPSSAAFPDLGQGAASASSWDRN